MVSGSETPHSHLIILFPLIPRFPRCSLYDPWLDFCPGLPVANPALRPCQPSFSVAQMWSVPPPAPSLDPYGPLEEAKTLAFPHPFCFSCTHWSVFVNTLLSLTLLRDTAHWHCTAVCFHTSHSTWFFKPSSDATLARRHFWGLHICRPRFLGEHLGPKERGLS